MNTNFFALLERQWELGKFVCVGLDTDYSKIPLCVRKNLSKGAAIEKFNQIIVSVTMGVACAYKINTAFYEAHGPEGITALKATIAYIHTHALNVPVILDAKRGDIGNTNDGYIQFAFDYLQADAITVHPYLGKESLQKFLAMKDKGIIPLCLTSNEGYGEFQNLMVDGEPLYCHVARHVANEWNGNNNCAVVVGATHPKELQTVRKIVGDMPILIPGIGAQGGDLKETVLAGKDSRGRGMIINSSRGIIFASNGDDFAEAACRAAIKLNDEIRFLIG
jgi:orotidine-5'-phosphate decarboxylase